MPPNKEALRMFHKSGKLAKRQIPRYKLKRQYTNVCKMIINGMDDRQIIMSGKGNSRLYLIHQDNTQASTAMQMSWKIIKKRFDIVGILNIL